LLVFFFENGLVVVMIDTTSLYVQRRVVKYSAGELVIAALPQTTPDCLSSAWILIHSSILSRVEAEMRWALIMTKLCVSALAAEAGNGEE
jgi:hypothetical protein